jgi:shikimate kinase
MIEKLTQRRNIVLSTGGGSVLDEISRQNLRSKGYVVYLKASVEILYERLKKSRNRPLMETEDKQKVIEDLLAEREPLYLAVADITIATDGRSAQDVAREIFNQYEKHV